MHTLDKVWIPFSTDSVETLELDASLEEPDGFTSSVSSVSTISDTSKPQLAPSIQSDKMCQARVRLFHLSVAGKMSASKLIQYFSSHPAAFGFQSYSLPDNITLNPASKKTDESQIFNWH